MLDIANWSSKLRDWDASMLLFQMLISVQKNVVHIFAWMCASIGIKSKRNVSFSVPMISTLFQPFIPFLPFSTPRILCISLLVSNDFRDRLNPICIYLCEYCPHIPTPSNLATFLLYCSITRITFPAVNRASCASLCRKKKWEIRLHGCLHFKMVHLYFEFFDLLVERVSGKKCSHLNLMISSKLSYLKFSSLL